jgi:hypothetical protein
MENKMIGLGTFDDDYLQQREAQNKLLTLLPPDQFGQIPPDARGTA